MQILQSISPKPELTEKIGNFRWRIVALLFYATTINFIDRRMLGLAADVPLPRRIAVLFWRSTAGWSGDFT